MSIYLLGTGMNIDDWHGSKQIKEQVTISCQTNHQTITPALMFYIFAWKYNTFKTITTT